MHIRIYRYTMDQLTFFKSLSDQTRIDILTFLLLRGESCVCDLMNALDLNQSKISRHLALLRSAKILQDRRQGQWVYYQIHPELEPWCVEMLNILLQQNTRAESFRISENTSICCD